MIEIQRVTDVLQYLDGLEAVIFDLDDTLYGEKEYVRSGYHAIAQILPQVKDATQKLWAAFESKKPAIDEVLLSEGIYTEDLKQRCLEVYRYHQPDIQLYEGVLPMLKTLRGEGYLLGIITDGRPEGQRVKLQALGLEHAVDHVIITDELGGVEYRKPNDTSFVRMRERLGVSFSEMCYVGDNMKKDFAAPEKLGMRSIWFRNLDGLYFYITDEDREMPR